MDPSILFGAHEAPEESSIIKGSSSNDVTRPSTPEGSTPRSKSEKRKERKSRKRAEAAAKAASDTVDETKRTDSNGKKRVLDEKKGNMDDSHDPPNKSSPANSSEQEIPHKRRKTEEDSKGDVSAILTDEFTAEATREIPTADFNSTNPSSSKKDDVDDAVKAEASGSVIGQSKTVVPANGVNGASAGSMQITHSVRHQVAIPKGKEKEYVALSKHVPPEVPAKTYPFTLDPFQQTAISSIQRGESVLVSAHTSAGKTVVAEYAIAQCLKNEQRVVYTSPIKALSNQKYRELKKEFGDVGLMTGDVTIDPNSSCLVMTTEILRSMLYRGSEIMREVAWVIFDEIHYMRDSERGVVWEETIILLPRKVRYVFLSATIPNAFQFASWIAKIHAQPCHIVYTDFRPTPLQHYLFPAGGDGIHLVVDEKSNFLEGNFQKAMGALSDSRGEDPASADSGKGRQKGQTKKGGQKGPSDIFKIVKMIMIKNSNPVIVFAFSKKECEALALQMSKLEFNTEDEKNMVSHVFNSAIGALSEEDRLLPQIQQILPLLRRGIGIHHGGLLPILKEIIELLFQEGLVKVLFATETFSIGLNMPAKTVVFTAVRKWDGKEFRNLTSGEFIQMSGRAGRRGLDDRGIVIMMFDEKLEPSAAKTMVKGEADRLNSAFHLGYNMILNLMRVEGISPEYMLERCFFQFQSADSVPQLEEDLEEAKEKAKAIEVPREEETNTYFNLHKQLDSLNREFKEITTHPDYSKPFLQPGRLVKVQHDGVDFGWCCVVNYQKKQFKPSEKEDSEHNQYIVECLMHVARGGVAPSMRDINRGADTLVNSGLHPVDLNEPGEMVVVPVLLSTIQVISGLRLKLPKELRSKDSRSQVKLRLRETFNRFPSTGKNAKGIPLLDPVKDMNINDDSFKSLLGKIAILEGELAKMAIHGSKELPTLYKAYKEKEEANEKVNEIEKRLKEAHSVLQLDELNCRKRVLRRLGFANKDDIVEKKGRVACEISTGDELLLTEMIFNGVFNELSEEQCAALLSCFVFNEKSNQQIKLKDDLAEPLRVMKEAASRIAKVSIESRLPVNEEEYISSFRVELMDAVLQWCKGAKFAEICKLTDIFEGSIIRAFRRLQELIRQMSQAAKAIGNKELEAKFDGALNKLERQGSIIFSPSLYL